MHSPCEKKTLEKYKMYRIDTLFHSVEDIKENSRRELNSIPKTAFKNVLMIGLFVSVSVSFLKEHTLKVTK
jgi:hypothetical protein